MATPLPDLRGRFPLGLDNMGGTSADVVTAAEADSLAGSGGAETHTLTIDEMPEHRHPLRGRGGSSSATQRSYFNLPSHSDVGADNYNSSSAIGSLGSDQPHNNMPPYLSLNYIIKT